MAIDFRIKQAEFAAYIRDPRLNPAPADINPLRMQIYHQLFFNNIDSSLSSNFPVLHKILDDEQWLELARDFFATHRCRTPYFSEIADEFLEYLQQRNHTGDYPFLLELAHYEWVEMALSISNAVAKTGDSSFTANVLQLNLALSPLAWPLAYQYPVQRISPDFLPETPPDDPTYLVVYRDLNDTVHFMHCSPLTYGLLQILEENQPITGESCLQLLAKEIKNVELTILEPEGLKLLQDMAEKGIIIPAEDA